MVNDLGGARDGSGEGSASPAPQVVDAVMAEGGRAVANGGDVSTMVGDEAIFHADFGQADILVTNAGMLRDQTFAKTEEADWDAVVRVT